LEKGKAVLRKIRGTDNIEPEFLELVEASRVAKEVKHPFRNLLKRNNRPQLVISIALMVCTNAVFTFFIFLNIYNMITKILNHGRNCVTIFIIAKNCSQINFKVKTAAIAISKKKKHCRGQNRDC
jgi:hypothetical protein